MKAVCAACGTKKFRIGGSRRWNVHRSHCCPLSSSLSLMRMSRSGTVILLECGPQRVRIPAGWSVVDVGEAPSDDEEKELQESNAARLF